MLGMMKAGADLVLDSKDDATTCGLNVCVYCGRATTRIALIAVDLNMATIEIWLVD